MTNSTTAQADCTKGLVLRVSDILTALATEGINVHRDAVVRASDKFLPRGKSDVRAFTPPMVRRRGRSLGHGLSTTA